MFKLRKIGFAALILLASASFSSMAATTVALNPDHPQNYVVQNGDTLWDIAARFLRAPWRWREIWRGNPQVRSADLIYPGDVLYLTYENGQAVIRSSREGRPVVKLSPRIRRGAVHTGAISAIPLDAVKQFLSRPEVVEEDELADAAYILSLGKERLVGGPGLTFYARGTALQNGARYTVVRKGSAYIDPELEGDEAVLGYEAMHIGDATMLVHGDPSTMRLISAKREVLVGDRLLPSSTDGALPAFMPHPPENEVRGEIISVVEGVTLIGPQQVVVLNRGSEDGVNVGTVLSVYQRGEELRDEFAKRLSTGLPEPDAQIELDLDHQRGLEGLVTVLDRFVRDSQKLIDIDTDDSFRDVTLPEEHSGTLMVFRTFDNLSYALVMAASRPMHLADIVRNP